MKTWNASGKKVMTPITMNAGARYNSTVLLSRPGRQPGNRRLRVGAAARTAVIDPSLLDVGRAPRDGDARPSDGPYRPLAVFIAAHASATAATGSAPVSRTLLRASPKGPQKAPNWALCGRG